MADTVWDATTSTWGSYSTDLKSCLDRNGLDYAKGSFLRTSGKFYFEADITGFGMVGVGTGPDKLNNNAYYLPGNQLYQRLNGTSNIISSIVPSPTGTRRGFKIDTVGKTIAITADGISYSSNYTLNGAGPYYIYFEGGASAYASGATIYTSKAEYKFSIPEGYDQWDSNTVMNLKEVTPANIYEQQHTSLFVSAKPYGTRVSTIHTFDSTDSTKFTVGGVDAYLDTRFTFTGDLKPVKHEEILELSKSGTIAGGTLFSIVLDKPGRIVSIRGGSL